MLEAICTPDTNDKCDEDTYSKSGVIWKNKYKISSSSLCRSYLLKTCITKTTAANYEKPEPSLTNKIV